MAKIMIIGNSIGGFYKFRKEFIEKFMMYGHSIVLVFPEGTYTSYFAEQGCKMISFKMERRGKNLLEEAKLLKSFYITIKREQPDIVMTYTIKPNIYAGIICRILKIPYLVSITGLGTSISGQGLKQKLLTYTYNLALQDASCVFFQNNANMQALSEPRKLKTTKLIPGSGVNLTEHCLEQYPEEKNAITFLTIGRIMQDKGTDEIIAAARQIKKTNPTVRFCLIGSFDEDYQEKIEKAVSEGVIEFCGYQTNVHSFIKNSHATIHASYHEGMSNVLLESASTGRPVIATDVPGCRETYENGVSGIACRVKDADDLTRAIRNFIELPHEEKAAMGRAGRKKMEQEFDRNIVIQAYLEEIGRIVGEQ